MIEKNPSLNASLSVVFLWWITLFIRLQNLNSFQHNSCNRHTRARIRSSLSFFPDRKILTFFEFRPNQSWSKSLLLSKDQSDNYVIENATTTLSPSTSIDFSILQEQILNLVESRYGLPSSPITSSLHPSKKKLRQYLYHSKERKNPMDIENIIDVMDYLDKVFFNEGNRAQLVQNILYTSPRILRKSVASELKPAVAFLKSLYGNDIFIQAVTRNPNLLLTRNLGFHADDDGEAVTSFFRSKLNMADKAIEKLKQSSPSVFRLSVEKSIEPVVQFLVSTFEDDSLSSSNTLSESINPKTRKVIARVVTNNPSLLHLNIESNLLPTVIFLRDNCFLDTVGMANLIKSCPGVLGLSVEDNLRPTLTFLMKEMGLDPMFSGEEVVVVSHDDELEDIVKTNLKRCLCRHPQILALSLENLKRKVEYFDLIDSISIRKKTKSTDKKQKSKQALATRIAISAPSTYSLSLKDNIIPKVQCLANMWSVPYPNSTSDSYSTINYSLAKRLAEYPPVLTLSLEGNLEPTIQFYNRTGYIKLDGIGETIQEEDTSNTSSVTNEIVRARHLATSLFNRLLPRWHYLVDEINHGDTSASANVDIPPPIHILASSTDEKFSDYYGLDPTDYKQYKLEAVPRLKFSNQFETWIKTGRPIDGI